MRLFVDRRVHHVIVVRGAKPVGVLARHDLLRVMAQSLSMGTPALRHG